MRSYVSLMEMVGSSWCCRWVDGEGWMIFVLVQRYMLIRDKVFDLLRIVMEAKIETHRDGIFPFFHFMRISFEK